MNEQKILIIEDNALNMLLVSDLLDLEGFQVVEAADAESGIDLARECVPDLILMDIQLPGMDGLEATRMIRNDPQLGEIPIVALTSHAMQGDDARALDAGCTGYLTKPINTRTFIDDLRQYLQSV